MLIHLLMGLRLKRLRARNAVTKGWGPSGGGASPTTRQLGAVTCCVHLEGAAIGPGPNPWMPGTGQDNAFADRATRTVFIVFVTVFVNEL